MWAPYFRPPSGWAHQRQTTHKSNQNVAPIRSLNPRGQRDYQDFTHCEVCDKDILTFRWEFHLNHPEHLRTQRLVATRSAINHTTDGKNDVEVSGETGVDFGVVEQESIFGSPSVESKVVKMRKTDNDARIRLAGFRLTSSGLSSGQASR